MKLILSWVLLVFLSTSVWAQSSEEKLLKLQAANDALTERVAELLKENRRLQQAVKEALSAQNSGSKIVAGCDSKGLHRAIAFENSGVGKKRAAMNWLKSNGEKCTQSQLRELRPIVNKTPYPDSPTELINFYLSLF